ncbi:MULTISPECIES: maleylacetoacetate isomerase [unclassified Xanthobacter]|uniref:maleylacetoacetate isomerase n=1 Tax=unclassified Xanthobacter TaxID=2623496 RepID=UPI001EDD609F|nr:MULTISPECIES: maleylacetoacetate isomerase [unclassified Xanthobacter]
MELYGFFRSSASYRLRIALAFKGLDYVPHFVSLPKMEHKLPAYLERNPEGLVPALVDGDGVFTQSMATMEYLDEAYPQPSLLPQGARERAYVRAVSQIICCDIHPLNNVRVLKYLGHRWGLSEAERNEWYGHWIGEGFQGLEATLAARGMAGRFVFGDAPTLADVCLVPQVFNANRFHCDVSGFKKIGEIFENCMALPCFESTQPKYQADAF